MKRDADRRGPVVVLIGADGMLGTAMAAELKARNWGFHAPTRQELDLARPETIKQYTRWPNPDSPPWFMINCAAWTDVDGAEEHEAEATAINGDVLAELAAACSPDMRLLTFSTDYVFDGCGTEPYRPDHPRSPVNAYGRSKAKGEEVLESIRTIDWLNIRTSWLYAAWGNNFVRTMQRLLWERPEVKVVDDQRGRPTWAIHLARASLALLDRGATGHWHVTDGGECSWYEFALEIKRLTGAPARVTPCTSDQFPRPAKRPAYSVLDLSRTEEALGPMPAWQQSLGQVLGFTTETQRHREEGRI